MRDPFSGEVTRAGTQTAGVLIAERWAEFVPDSSTDPVWPSSGPTHAMQGVVLVVDDEPDVQRLTQTLLTRSGYHVVVARHGKEAITLPKDHCPDLIVLDLNMAGDRAVAILRERGGRTPS